MIDEADVVFVDTKDEKEMEERINRGCPPASHPHVCIIFLSVVVFIIIFYKNI